MRVETTYIYEVGDMVNVDICGIRYYNRKVIAVGHDHTIYAVQISDEFIGYAFSHDMRLYDEERDGKEAYNQSLSKISYAAKFAGELVKVPRDPEMFSKDDKLEEFRIVGGGVDFSKNLGYTYIAQSVENSSYRVNLCSSSQLAEYNLILTSDHELSIVDNGVPKPSFKRHEIALYDFGMDGGCSNLVRIEGIWCGIKSDSDSKEYTTIYDVRFFSESAKEMRIYPKVREENLKKVTEPFKKGEIVAVLFTNAEVTGNLDISDSHGLFEISDIIPGTDVNGDYILFYNLKRIDGKNKYVEYILRGVPQQYLIPTLSKNKKRR